MRNLPSLLFVFAAGCITINVPESTKGKEQEKAGAAKAPEKEAEKKPSDEKAPAADPTPAPQPQPAPAPKPEEKKAQEAKPQEAPKAEEKKAPEKKKDEKPFEEVIKDKDKTTGLFTTYKDKDNFLLAIKPEQLGQSFLVMTTLSRGIGEGWLLTGMPLEEFLLRFEKREDKVNLFKVNTQFRATKGTPAARSVEKTYSDSLFATLKVETTDPESKAVLINLQNLLLSDFSGLQEIVKWSTGSKYGVKKEASYVDDLRNFPKNMELNTALFFEAEGGRAGTSEVLADARYLRLGLHYSIAQLPEDSTYRPRIADDRVGHFLVARMDFDPKREDPNFDRYAIRWNLEKADATLPISPPKKPITFYIENTTPYEYRDAVKDGILVWNKAFEAAGFKDAVQAVIMSDDADWDPADMRYNVIRWINSSSGSFAGMGPARVNPLTGEILDADVLIEGEAIRSIRRYYQRYVQPVTHESWEVKPDPNGRWGCSMSQGLQQEANFAVLAMLVRGEMKPEDPVPAEFVKGYIVDLVAHEVGHVLGLRHNFKASTLLPVEKLHDTGATRSIGLVGSVMDYNGINVAPPGMKQGDYFPAVVGPYDVWAVEYAYTPFPDAKTPEEELPALKKIASRCADPALAYGTDEDTFGISALSPDPRSTHWDLGSDPLAYCKTQQALIQETLEKFAPVVVKEGDNFVAVRNTLSGLLFQTARNAATVCKYVGGVYMERAHKGDPGAKEPFYPVPAAKQREALEYLTKNVFAADAFRFKPELLRMLQLDRWWHWGTMGWTTEIDFPIQERIAAIQRMPLGWLFQPLVLKRVLNNEAKFASGEESFRLPELFERVENAIWSEVGPAVEASFKGTSGELPSHRRALQREHVGLLIGLLHQGSSWAVPEDARTLANASLNRLLARISRMKPIALEGYTGPHLTETETRIRKALDAHMQMPGR